MVDNNQEKQKLLIVDDSKVIRVTARKILRDHFETIEAVDGENAWEILSAETSIGLVVSDLTMPNLDGYALLERIRNSQLPHVRDLPVIIITGANDSEATRQRARDLGATDFIGKPFDAVHLLARTQAHADAHATRGGRRRGNTLLEEDTGTDMITGLCNEATFMERGYQLLSYAIRHDSSLAVLRIEIDGYGDLFREYGDGFTETVVLAMGQLLEMATRHEDTAARIGPARFAILAPGMDSHGVRNLAERINRDFGTRTFSAGKRRIQVTASIGVSNPDVRRDTRFDELLSIADRRLAHAMKLGGNRIVRDDRKNAPETGVPMAVAPANPATPAAAADGSEGPGTATLEMLLAGGAELEIEEIELSAPDFSFTQPFATRTSHAGARSSASRSAPAGASGAERPGRTAPAGGPAADRPGTTPASPLDRPGTERPPASPPAEQLHTQTGDTVVISAPFPAPDASKAATPGSSAETPSAATHKAAPEPAVKKTGVPVNALQDDPPPRRKRFFSSPLRLFGRSRTRK